MRRGALARLALLALVWGSSYLWIKIALRGFTPTQILLVRLALGALVLLAAVRFAKLRLPRGTMVWVHLGVAALLANVVPFLLFAVGEQTVDSGLAGALNATTPLWALLVGVFAGRQRAKLTPALLAGLVVGFTGAVLIFEPWQSGASAPAMGGVLACLAAALSYALGYTYIDRTLAGRGIPPVALVAAQLLAATAIAAVTTPFAGLTPIHLRADAVIALVILGALGTGYAVLLNYRLIEDDGATLASTVAYLLPIVAVTLGVLTLGEPVTAITLAGVALVLAGIALTRRRPAPAALPSTTAPDAAKPVPSPVLEPAAEGPSSRRG
ncbi:DMT family transporter [Streptomyces ficellus]|uniref:DMT family transporter n=1 Tax=Streptomyces ficellus TaxID=1977088 RepID=A0ABT7Z637_9ACTN|nr:DMT family transporter [Streptomyces ficellus]MDN3294965.1 DMT family transporter [Streptomyces ficellus]